MKLKKIFFLLFTFYFFTILQAQELEEIITIQNPFSGDEQFNNIVRGPGDLNGDGYYDFVITNKIYGGWYFYPGEVRVYLGKDYPSDIPDFIIYGEGPYDMFGNTVCINGDINDDGYDDLIIGAPENQPSGKVFIYFGSEDFNTEVDIILAGEDYSTGTNGWRFGNVDASGDFNNDGISDLMIGAGGAQMNLCGQVDIFYGGNPFDVESDFHIEGEPLEGYGGGLIGDINGDCFDDFMALHLNEYFGILADLYLGGYAFSSQPDKVINLDSLGYYGNGIICEDINVDGYKDLIYPHLNYDDQFIKILYCDSLLSFSDIDSIDCYDSGFTNFFASDINNDNQQDIIACFERDGFQNYAGSVYIYFGGTLLDTIPDYYMTGSYNFEYFGETGYNIGDVNGDGNNDILLGTKTSVSCLINDYIKVFSEENLVSAGNNQFPVPKYKLHNYPNPFNPITTISYDLPINVENPVIEIFNIKGERIRELKIENVKCKINSIIWYGTDNHRKPVSSGIYLYRLKTDEGVLISKKMLLLK